MPVLKKEPEKINESPKNVAVNLQKSKKNNPVENLEANTYVSKNLHFATESYAIAPFSTNSGSTTTPEAPSYPLNSLRELRSLVGKLRYVHFGASRRCNRRSLLRFIYVFLHLHAQLLFLHQCQSNEYVLPYSLRRNKWRK